jgi:hypothetical protein
MYKPLVITTGAVMPNKGAEDQESPHLLISCETFEQEVRRPGVS